MKKHKEIMDNGKKTHLPKGWKMMMFEEVCEKIFAGGDKPKKISKNKTKEFFIPIYANGEKNKGLYGYTNHEKVKKPSITISGRGTIGYSEIRTEPFVPIVRLITLIPNKKIVNINFLHYGIKNIDFSNTGTSIPQLTIPMIKNYTIPIPPLSEQKRIVAILDKAFQAIDQAKAHTEQNLKNAKEVFESYLNGIFEKGKEKIESGEWEERKIGEILTLEYGKPLHKSKRTSKGKYPVYGANGIKAYSNEFHHNKKTVIIGRKGTVGAIHLSDKKFWPLDVTYYAVFDEKIINLYFLYYLLSKLHLPKLAKGVKPGINRNDVYKIKVTIPSLIEQKQIVAQLDELQAKTQGLEKLYQQKIVNLEELKKSILKKAFRGEL